MNDSRKKILYVHHSGLLAGAPKSLSYIIENIDHEIYDAKLINIENGNVNDFFKKLNIDFEKVNGIRPFHGSTVVKKSTKLFIRNWFFLIPSVFRANKLIKKTKPDLIHLNSTCLFAFAIAAKWNKVKTICHVREPIRKGFFWGAPLRFFSKNYIQAFISICQNDLDSLRLPKKHSKKVEVIYNFVDKFKKEEEQNNDFRNELGLDNSDVVFLYLARFSESNGWKFLLQQAEQITLKNKNYHFVLVGAQNDGVVSLTKNPNIHILRFRNDIDKVFQSSDIFVCPFIEPHFARGVIEASAQGLPIIANDIGGVNELVIPNETGYLYKNETQFQEFCEKLGEDKIKRQKMGEKGIKLAKKDFNITNNLKKTFDFYKEVLKDKV